MTDMQKRLIAAAQRVEKTMEMAGSVPTRLTRRFGIISAPFSPVWWAAMAS